MPDTAPDTSNSAAESAPRDKDLRGLEQLLDRIEARAQRQDELAVADMVDMAGSRWFAPMLLVPGLVMLVPGVGDIPGVPVIMGLLVILACVQLLLGRDTIWLPQWLGKRSAQCRHVEKTVSWMHKPARFLDRLARPRLRWVLRHAGIYVITATCIVIAAATPIMEVIPFSAGLAGAAITAFGLALLADDGLIALVAIAFSIGTFALLIMQFL